MSNSQWRQGTSVGLTAQLIQITHGFTEHLQPAEERSKAMVGHGGPWWEEN